MLCGVLSSFRLILNLNATFLRLCVQIPFAGGRVFEKGDEEFLRLRLKGQLFYLCKSIYAEDQRMSVPVIVVFTQFDKVILRQEEHLTDDELEMTQEQINALTFERAENAFQESCIGQLGKVGPNLPHAKVSSPI
jgi:hypothetical protein